MFIQFMVECLDLAVVEAKFLQMLISVFKINCAHYTGKDSVEVNFYGKHDVLTQR